MCDHDDHDDDYEVRIKGGTKEQTLKVKNENKAGNTPWC